jgi:Fe-S oxidoreductase
MGIPVIVGASEKLERTGVTFQGECPSCGAAQRFYEAKKRFNVTVFFTVSLWDSEELVVQCGHCQGCFAHGSIKAVATTPAPTLRERLTRAVASTKTAPRVSEEEEISAELAALKKRLRGG